MDRLMQATPKQLLLAAGIVLVATVLLAELVTMLDRAWMARYDPAKLQEEVDEYLGEHTEDD